jgi:SulP family sulfate permease
MIIAMAIGALAALAIDVASAGRSGITTVGALPASLPPVSMPNLSVAAIRETAAIALAITILALTEAVSIARSIAVRSGQRIDNTQEFIGQGLSNVAGAFFSSYASSGSFNRSGVNYDAGARTPLAAASSALFLLAILFAVAPLAAYLPHAAMAAVLVIVAWGLIDIKGIRQILRTSRNEAAVLVLTFLSGVFVSLEFCILAGVMLSLLLYLNRTSRPALETTAARVPRGARGSLAPRTSLARAARPSKACQTSQALLRGARASRCCALSWAPQTPRTVSGSRSWRTRTG